MAMKLEGIYQYLTQNPSNMGDGRDKHLVCETDDVSEGSPAVVDVNGTEIAIFQLEGEYFAIQNTCPHQGGPLGSGKVEDECVYCPWHGWQFDLKSGEHVQGRETAQTYNTWVEDGSIYLQLT